MIPESLINDNLEITNDIETTNTYKISETKIQGFVDALDALRQFIYKCLDTEKYEYTIYSFDYGIELDSLIGKDEAYVKVELKRRIIECLLKDERITSVENFSFTVTGDAMLCKFDVHSIYGEITITKEVNV